MGGGRGAPMVREKAPSPPTGRTGPLTWMVLVFLSIISHLYLTFPLNTELKQTLNQVSS